MLWEKSIRLTLDLRIFVDDELLELTSRVGLLISELKLINFLGTGRHPNRERFTISVLDGFPVHKDVLQVEFICFLLQV